MKKTAKLFGAVALSAALACGTVAPAFAEDSGPAELKDRDVVKTANAADTFINVKTEVDQLNVTVPLHSTIVAKTGGAVLTPTNYKISNNSYTDIKVTKVSVAENKAADWKLVNTKAGVSGTTGTGAAGTFYLQLTPTVSGTAGNGLALMAGDSVLTTSGSVTGSTGFEWPVVTAKANDGTVTSMDFTWDAAASLKKTIKDNGEIVDVFTVSYTIATAGEVDASATHIGGNGAEHQTA